MNAFTFLTPVHCTSAESTPGYTTELNPDSTTQLTPTMDTAEVEVAGWTKEIYNLDKYDMEIHGQVMTVKVRD